MSGFVHKRNSGCKGGGGRSRLDESFERGLDKDRHTSNLFASGLACI